MPRMLDTDILFKGQVWKVRTSVATFKHDTVKAGADGGARFGWGGTLGSSSAEWREAVWLLGSQAGVFLLRHLHVTPVSGVHSPFPLLPFPFSGLFSGRGSAVSPLPLRMGLNHCVPRSLLTIENNFRTQGIARCRQAHSSNWCR